MKKNIAAALTAALCIASVGCDSQVVPEGASDSSGSGSTTEQTTPRDRTGGENEGHVPLSPSDLIRGGSVEATNVVKSKDAREFRQLSTMKGEAADYLIETEKLLADAGFASSGLEGDVHAYSKGAENVKIRILPAKSGEEGFRVHLVWTSPAG